MSPPHKKKENFDNFTSYISRAISLDKFTLTNFTSLFSFFSYIFFREMALQHNISKRKRKCSQEVVTEPQTNDPSMREFIMKLMAMNNEDAFAFLGSFFLSFLKRDRERKKNCLFTILLL